MRRARSGGPGRLGRFGAPLRPPGWCSGLVGAAGASSLTPRRPQETGASTRRPSGHSGAGRGVLFAARCVGVAAVLARCWWPLTPAATRAGARLLARRLGTAWRLGGRSRCRGGGPLRLLARRRRLALRASRGGARIGGGRVAGDRCSRGRGGDVVLCGNLGCDRGRPGRGRRGGPPCVAAHVRGLPLRARAPTARLRRGRAVLSRSLRGCGRLRGIGPLRGIARLSGRFLDGGSLAGDLSRFRCGRGGGCSVGVFDDRDGLLRARSRFRGDVRRRLAWLRDAIHRSTIGNFCLRQNVTRHEAAQSLADH
ncbi:hypothetical protein DSM104329_03650 [Capillimicrobium parvum]|uniref:Uncharacterized protein n=1 Tax=Capillimicrobium parvum TaxID=2884022 RepID=A0A9E6XZB4_9ACTN|nr:hypothetical protein DSM104329_03650 [Capillimicrobium parvum]